MLCSHYRGVPVANQRHHRISFHDLTFQFDSCVYILTV